MDDLRRQGQQGLLAAQMTAVVIEKQEPNKKVRYKTYRLPTAIEFKAAVVEIEDLEEGLLGVPFGLLNEPMPPAGAPGCVFNFMALGNGVTCLLHAKPLRLVCS
jgi:hypothetical protein